MATKAKPAAKAPAANKSARIVGIWHQYPKLTLGTVATLIAIITGIAPWVTGWLSQFITRQEYDVHLRGEAWRYVETVRLSATAARNRVNDCNLLKEQRRAVSPLERATCDQYAQDLAEANAKIADAVNEAKLLSGGKRVKKQEDE